MSALDDMIAGYRRFRDGNWTEQRERWDAAAKGQSPATLVVACSDSRVDPATIFDTRPGEVFVVRNVAALVPPFDDSDDGSQHGTSAAIEFAVTQLKVEQIVVMGHESCGGCKAALSRAFRDAEPGKGGFVANWVGMLDAARDRVVASHGDGGDAQAAMEQAAVRVSLDNLRGFPFVRAAEETGDLTLTGSWFAIRTGKLEVLDEQSGTFAPV